MAICAISHCRRGWRFSVPAGAHRLDDMVKPVVAVVLGLLLSACTREVANPQAKPQPPAAPISALQVGDLLSPDVPDKDGNLFVTAAPEQCTGVARESEPPFIDSHGPVASDGGHWATTGAGGAEVYVAEMVAVFPADFDARDALAAARETIESCHGTQVTVTSMKGRTYLFDVLPPAQPDPENTVAWSLRSHGWDCDNAFIAAHNAAIEITGCGTAGGFDIAAAAQGAAKRIENLANTTA